MPNLVGTTKIELTDIHTGKVETFENHNMVTNAIRDIFRPLGLSLRPSYYFNNFVPYYQKLLGGILCFDTEIKEDADDYYAPASANLVGCASYGVQNNTKNTFRGGFNQTESEVNLKDRYVKYVYDFATSQANGTIASVCLTHANGGYTSYGSKNAVYATSISLLQPIAEDTLQYVYPSYTGGATSSRYSGYSMGTTEMIFLIDRENDCALYLKIKDKSHVSITKRRTFLKTVSILDNVYSTKPLIEEIDIAAFSKELRTNYLGYNYDPATDCLYICCNSDSRVAANGTLLVTEIKMDTWGVRQFEVVNATDKYLRTDGTWAFFVTNGYLYLKGYESPYEIYKIQISNPANVVKIKRTGVSSVNGVPKMVINDRIYYDNYNNHLCIVNAHTNEVLPPECQSFFNNSSHQLSLTPVRNEPLLYFADYGTYSTAGWYMMCNYLATINNLDTPVTKTADKTMKITYILQEQ